MAVMPMLVIVIVFISKAKLDKYNMNTNKEEREAKKMLLGSFMLIFSLSYSNGGSV